MYTCKSIVSVKKLIKDWKKKGEIIGFVPTMGALHEGHISLIKRARKECDKIVVSIFVNPLQFGQNEDYKIYPRPVKKDKNILKQEKVDILFQPEMKIIYPEKNLAFVDIEKISNIMCGASRPGHFKGVATIVTKLFNIVEPDIVYFGQKDYQQALIIKKIIRDLNFDIKMVICPIVREPDGLALSSRNVYLNKKEREKVLCLKNSLFLAKEFIQKKGIKDTKYIIKKARELISDYKGVKIDYFVIADCKDLKILNNIENSKNILIAGAVHIGKTKLIDNIIIRKLRIENREL